MEALSTDTHNLFQAIANPDLNVDQLKALEYIRLKSGEIKSQWNQNKVFPYFIIDDFLPNEFAEKILAAYPPPDEPGWDKTTYVHQRKKFSKRSDFPSPIQDFFTLVNSGEFLNLLSDITGIRELLSDPDYVGGGLHQIVRDGFLDVHVDFNFHPKYKYHRRANLLVYMNKNWKPEYEGYLELWDMKEKKQLEKIAPIFNRAVMFETNEVSFHGHPKPLACPQEITRKSLAVYYYTKTLENRMPSNEHNTLYKQTTGTKGYMKTFLSSIIATKERFRIGGLKLVKKRLRDGLLRFLRGQPPENK